MSGSVAASGPPPLPVASFEASATGRSRFAFIDALRGLAALAVCFHHIEMYAPWRDYGPEWLTDTARLIGKNGKLGVPVFFVISGFVIAYSVRRAHINWRYIGNFALVRYLRLAPPYFVTIALVTAVNAMCLFVWNYPPATQLPSIWQLVAHALYLQNLLGLGNLSVGFWTLCIEFQFYLLFVMSLGVVQWCSRRGDGAAAEPSVSPPRLGHAALLVLFAPAALSSLFFFSYDSRYEDWFVKFYCMFCLGALAWWCVDGQAPRWWFWLYVLLFVVRIGREVQLEEQYWNKGLIVAVLAGVGSYWAGRTGQLGTWLNWAPLQYLGLVSYSLYLVHFPLSHVLMETGLRVTGESELSAFCWMAVSVVTSVLLAGLFYRVVEAPSVQLSGRFKQRGADVKSSPAA